ncbi:MAG: hypothetical protein PF689_14640 [Deltaproteobacteria bacterium]|jgi:hypothetical protein|nr:hypothetical protein [Deltaproteobacteria bacterium]
MAKDKSENEDLNILKENISKDGKIILKDDVYIIVTQAFCPNGHNLVGCGKEDFDGYPGICVKVANDEKEGMLELSPFQGDHSKRGVTFPQGTKVKIKCPTCGVEFPVVGRCKCEDGHLHKIYLNPKLNDAHMIVVCDAWGCYFSRLIDDNELFSEFIDEE